MNRNQKLAQAKRKLDSYKKARSTGQSTRASVIGSPLVAPSDLMNPGSPDAAPGNSQAFNLYSHDNQDDPPSRPLRMLRNPSADFSTNTLDAGQIVLEQLSALEREKEQWEGQCTALQNELDAVSRLYDASQEMVDSLKQTLESEVEDKNALEKSLQESQESYAVLQRQYQDLQMHQQQQIPSETTGVVENATLTPPEDLVERLADLEQALQEWQDRCSLLEALNSKEAEFQDLVGQERTQFENQMQDYEAKIQALESALQQQASSSEDAEQLRLELDSLRQQNEALSATQSLSQDSTLLKDLQERYDSSQTAIQQLEAERNSFELKIQELQDQQAQAANNINSDLDPMQQKHEYEEALRELHIVRSQLETEISMKETLQQETLQLMEEIQSQESLLQGRTAEWDVERESLRREIDDLTSRLDSDRHSWEREKAVLESQIEEVQLTAQLDASADLLDEGWGLNGTGEDPGQTGSSNSLPKKTVAQLEFDIQALQVVLDSTTQSYETQLAQTSLLLAESNSKLTSLSGLEAEYSRLRKEFDALQSQALEFQSELAKAKENAEANSSQMRSEMDALQFENEQLKVAQSSTEETSARIQELQSRLERLQLELESSRQDYANLVQEKTHQETLQRSLSQEQVEEIQSLQQKLASLSLDNLTQSQELAQEKEQVVQALQADLEKTAAEMDEMRQYILQREMELQDNGLALEECHGQIENLNGSLTELRTRLDQTDDTTRAYEDQISGLNDSIQGYLSQIAQLQDSLEQYREREETLVIEREIETQELMDLRNQSILRQTGETEELRQAMEENERLRNSVQEKESHLSQLNEEIFAIQELLQEKEALISQHEEELGAARDALLEKEEAERQRIHLTNEVADMESRLAALDEELSDYKSQIEALHIQISNKEGIIQQCDADLDEKEATIQSLERDLEAKEALIQILKRDAEALNSTLQALEADIAAKGDMEDIQHDLAQKDSIIREFEQGMAAKTAVIDRLENEVTKTAADLQGLEENLLSKDSDILTWKQEVAMKDSALLELQETVTSRDLNIQELQQQVETLSLDIERLQSSQRRLEEDYDFMRQNLEEETELFRQGLDHLNREKAELTETVARIQAELQSKTDEVESARSAVPEEFAGEFETLQYQLSAQTKELYSILDERQNMQYRIDELTLQLEELGSERSHEAQELHAQIEELASENQKYKEQITQIMSSSDELEGLKEKMAYLENVNSACQTDLEKLAEERNALELANASLVEEASILGAKLDVLTEKLRDIAGARDESDQYAAQMESENQQLKLDLDTIYAERNNLEDRLNAAQQNTESSEALALLTQELDVLRMSYAGLQSQNQELHTHIDQLSVDLQAAKVASEDASKKLMLEVSRLEEEREALTMQVSDFGSLTKDREENSALTSQVQDLLLQNEESSRVTQKLAMELDQAREDHSRAVHELQTQFDDSQTWATLVSQERDRLLEKVNEVEQNLDGVQSVASQLQGLREENEKLKQHQEEIVASFKAQELELDSQIDRLMKENDEIQKRLETMAGLQVIADGVEEMKEQHLAQVGALEGQVNDLYAQVESLMSKIDQLESEKEELSMRCQQLAWEMSTISARIQTEDYAAIQSELERAQGDARTGQLRLQELEEVILSTQKELQDRHNQVESLTQLVSQRDEAVADLQAQYNSASLELTEVAEKCASLEEASMLFEQQRDAIAQKLQEIAAERDAMDSARERHVEEIASLRQEMGGLQARIDGDNQAHLQAQGSNKETVEENERLWKRIETLMAEAEAMKDQTALLEGDLENSRTKLTELTDRLQLSSSEQDQVAENLRGELMAKIQEIETLEANLSHIQTEMEATDGSYKQIVAKYESAESKMHDFDDAISVLGDLSLKLGAQFTLKSAIEDILREKTSAEAKLEGLVQSFGTTTDSLVKLEEELAHKRERINDLETQLVQQRKGGEDANMLLETLRNITEDNNHLKNQLQTLYLEKEQIQMSLGDSEALQKLRKDHANLEDSYRAALEKLSSVETAASLSRQTSPVRHPLPSPQLVNQDLGADKQRLRDASFNLLMAQQESIQLNNTLSKANITIERLQHDLQLAEHNASLKLDEATGVIKVLEREVANLRALISKEPKRYPIGSPEPQVTSFRSVTPFSEFNSDSRFTRQQKIEAKLMSYVRLSENSIQSMEMYRTELLNKQEQLQDAEKEIMKLRTAIASTSVMSTATTSDSFRRLLSQLGSLIEATESNNELSKAIYHEVTAKPGPTVAFETSEDDMSPRNSSRQKGKNLLRMIKSQSQLLQDHKQVLENVEKAAFSGNVRPDSHRNNIDLVSLTEQFVDGISEYQNLVSVLIDSIDSIQHSLRSAKGTISTEMERDMSLVASRVDSIGMQYNVIEKEIQYVRKVLKKQSASRPDSMVPDSEYGAGDLTRLDDEEYKDQLENARSLVEVLSKEVEVLQESMSSILDETVTSHDEKPRKSTQLLQRQVSELRKVWAHEVSANSILRNLVSKCQSDSARTEDKLHKQYDSLREEFDELAELYDSSRNEIDLLRSEALIREKDLISLKARIQTDASSFLSRGETDEVARRERFAMNELVRSLEQQRDKLLEDVKQIATFKEQSEKLAKDLDSAQSDLSASQQKVADLETALVTAKSDAEKSERTLLLEKTVDEERELSEVSRKRSNDLQTKLDNLLRTNLSLTMDCKNALLKVAELEAQLTAAPSASALDDLSQSKREYEEKIAEILAAKSRLEKTLSQKELEWESERLKFRAQLKEASSTKNQDFISLSAEKADASLKLAERDADLKAAKLRTAELKSQLDRLTAEKTTKTKELENELSQAKAQATAAAEQATNERAKAKKLARKVEDLRSRVVELKDDKTKLESVVNGKEQSAKLYEDLQNCLKEYRSLKGLYDQTVQWVKLALEKTTGETDIEVFDQEAKQLRVDIDSLKRNLGVLVQELIYGRTLVVRLSMWRSDLSYQKTFISLRMDVESQKSILALNAISASPNLSPLQRLRSFVFVVIAANRMSVMAQSWQEVTKEFIVNVFEDQ